MRVAVIAAGSFAVPVLELLVSSRHRIVGVVSKPDLPRGRRHVVTPCPAARWAEAAGVTVLKPPRVSDHGFGPRFRALGADVGVVVDFGEILKPFVFDWLPHGFFGVHPSLLPRWRGAAPIPWTILAGDTTSGVSVFKLSDAVDAGQLALQVAVPVGERETSPGLAKRLAEEAGPALCTVLDRLEEGTLRLAPQPSAGASMAPKLKPEQGIIDWREDAWALDRKVRALLPWPCAWFDFRHRALKVLRAFPLACDHGHEPGTVLGPGSVEGVEGVRIACGSGVLVLLEVHSPSKRPVPAVAWLRGARLAPNEVLPSPPRGSLA